MANRRRRKQSSSEELFESLVWLTAVAIAIGVAVALIGIAVAVDGLHYGFEKVRKRDTRGLLVTRWLIFRLRHRRAPLRVRTLGELLTLTPAEFEEAVAQMLRDRGYRDVKRCGGPGDLGVDITARDSRGQKIAVQCKRYTPGNLVGSRDIQLFIGMTTTHHQVDRGVYVTTSGYTTQARLLAEKHPINLIDGKELCRILGHGWTAPSAGGELLPAS